MRRSLFALVAAVAVLLPATAAQAADGDIIVHREPGLTAASAPTCAPTPA